MSFAVRPSTDLVSVEAGANVPLSMEVSNRSGEQDRYEIEIEGLDPEWVAVPVPSFTVEPGETSSEKVFFRPPRASESLAGNYPFVIKVRSLSSGEQRTSQGVLQIRPYHHVSMEVSPKKGSISPFRLENRFTATIINLGNIEHSLQLTGTDPEEACAFEFAQDQVTVSPGQQKEVELTVTPTTTSVLASSRLYGFQIMARGIDTPTVSASSQAQLEQRAFLSPGTLAFLIFAVLLAGAWLYMMPKPPTLEMWVDKETITLGEPYQVSWRASHATRVTIDSGGQTVYNGSDATGSVQVRPKSGGETVLTGVARRGDKTSDTQQARVVVQIPDPAPDPEIVTFKANRTSVVLGQTVILSYRVNEAVVKATLAPLNLELNLKSNEIEVPLNDPGEKTFTLIAENRDGKAVRATQTVTVEDRSEATIIVFRAEPKVLEYTGGLVTLTWQLTNAVRAEISDGRVTVEVNSTKGQQDVAVDRTTTFTLTGWDKNRKTVTESFTVTVKPPPVADPTMTPGGPSATPPGGGRG